MCFCECQDNLWSSAFQSSEVIFSLVCLERVETIFSHMCFGHDETIFG